MLRGTILGRLLAPPDHLHFNVLTQAVAVAQSFLCMHGRYCGKGCSGVADGESYKASPIDELDRACFFHDKCFTEYLGCDCKHCHCNARLGAVANQVRG